MHKTLTVKELKNALVFRLTVTTQRGSATKEVARFANSGMGWVALGAAGRYLGTTMHLDEIAFDGSRDTYERLVGLGVIDPIRVDA